MGHIKSFIINLIHKLKAQLSSTPLTGAGGEWGRRERKLLATVARDGGDKQLGPDTWGKSGTEVVDVEMEDEDLES